MISGVTSGCNQAEMCDIIGVTVIGRNSEHHVGEATFGTGVMATFGTSTACECHFLINKSSNKLKLNHSII